MVPEPVLAHYARQQRTTAATLVAARRQWSRVAAGEFDTAWQSIGPRLFALTVAAQTSAAADGAAYIPDTLDALNLDAPEEATVDVAALTGTAADGRPLASLLYEPVITTKQAIARGLSVQQAASAGLTQLETILRSEVADAARQGAGLAIAARPAVTGWVRMLNPPSCPRCAVLAGKFYRWNTGFPRHPRCDCRHIPATEAIAGDLTVDPRAAIEAGQVHGLSKADHRAIVEDGADVGQVINAHRGMSTVRAFGRSLKVTTGGTTSRSVVGRELGATRQSAVGSGDRYRRARVPRLRPEEIYRQAAGDRAEAIRLLRRFGYLT